MRNSRVTRQRQFTRYRNRSMRACAGGARRKVSSEALQQRCRTFDVDQSARRRRCSPHRAAGATRPADTPRAGSPRPAPVRATRCADDAAVRRASDASAAIVSPRPPRRAAPRPSPADARCRRMSSRRSPRLRPRCRRRIPESVRRKCSGDMCDSAPTHTSTPTAWVALFRGHHIENLAHEVLHQRGFMHGGLFLNADSVSQGR